MFPTVNGVTLIELGNIKTNDVPPSVVIEDVIIDKQRVNPKTQPMLPPGRGDLEIHYTGLSLTAPEMARFKYMLEGFDTQWNEVGTRRLANYTGLRPGHYRFRVLASNNDGVWNEEGAEFKFYLEPYFYQTYWFYALCIVLTFISGMGLHRVRVRQVKEKFVAVTAERSRIARDLHDTLAQGLSGIGIHLDTVSKSFANKPEVATRYLELARNLVRYNQEEVRRCLKDLRAQELERGGLQTALSDTAAQLTAGKNIQVRSQVGGNPERLPGLIENNLFRLGQESVTNAVKHAQPSNIYIEIIFNASSVKMFIQDDGCGFDTSEVLEKSDRHFGLIGMSERAERLGGQLILNSTPGQGTLVEVEVPIG